MAASAGRDLLLKLGSGSPLSYTTIAAARSNSMTFDNSEVDITTMDDAGVRQLLAGAGVRSAAASISGIFTDAAGHAALMTAVNAGTHVNLQLANATNSIIIAGVFQVTSFEIAGDEGDAVTFSASFASAGTVTITNS